MGVDEEAVEREELADEMGDFGLQRVGGLEVIELGLAPAQSGSRGLFHEADLGVKVGLLLGGGEGVPGEKCQVTRFGIFKWTGDDTMISEASGQYKQRHLETGRDRRERRSQSRPREATPTIAVQEP